MDYETACAVTVTKACAVREVLKHCADVQEFFADLGEHEEYSGQVVLDWLGY